MDFLHQAVETFGVVPVSIAFFILGSMALMAIGLAPLAFEED